MELITLWILFSQLLLGGSYVLRFREISDFRRSSLNANEFEGFKESIDKLIRSNPLFAPFLSEPTKKEAIPLTEKKSIQTSSKPTLSINQVITEETNELSDQINYYRSILLPAIQKEASKPLPKQLINNALKEIEKLLGQKYRLETQLYEKYSKPTEDSPFVIDTSSLSSYDSSSDIMFNSLEGAWRLIYTTGTKDLQKTFSNDTFINYFPLKAVQSFSYKTGPNQYNVISNGIYWDTFPIIQFQGNFLIEPRLKKVIFDFEKVKLLNLITIPVSSYNASDFNPKVGVTERLNKKPFFKWILADKVMAVARGRSGGLALWRREEEMEPILLPSRELEINK